MGQQVEMPNLYHAIVTFLPPDVMVLDGTPFGLDGRLSTDRAACHFSAADSGREVRALIESLLL